MLSFHGTFFVLAREGGAQVLDHPVCINYMFLDSKLPKKLGGNWPRSRNTGASNRIGNNISTVFGWFYCLYCVAKGSNLLERRENGSNNFTFLVFRNNSRIHSQAFHFYYCIHLNFLLTFDRKSLSIKPFSITSSTIVSFTLCFTV